MENQNQDSLKNRIINDANKNNINNTNVDNSVPLEQLNILKQLVAAKTNYNNIPLKLDFDESEMDKVMTTITQVTKKVEAIFQSIENKKFPELDDVKNKLLAIYDITKKFDKDGIAGKGAENTVLELTIALETLNNEVNKLRDNCSKDNGLQELFGTLGGNLTPLIDKLIPELQNEVSHLTDGMERISEAAKFNTGNTIFDVFLDSIQKVRPGITGILQDIQEVRDANNEPINIGVSINSESIEQTLNQLFPKSNDNNNNNSLKEIDDIAKQKVNEFLIGYTKSLNINVNTAGINNMNIVGRTSDVFADTKKKYQKIYDSVIDALNAQQQDLENQLENISSANDDKRLSIETEINNIKSQKENLEETLKKNIQDDIKSIAEQYGRVINQYHTDGSFDMNAYDSVGAIKSTTGNTNKSLEHLYKSVSDMNVLSGTDANKDIDKILGSKNVDLGSVIKSTKSALGSTKFLSDRLDNGRIMGNIQKAKETGDTELLKQSMAELNPVIDEFNNLKKVASDLSGILKIDANGNKEIEALQKAVRQVLNNIISFGLALGETRNNILEVAGDLGEEQKELGEEIKNEVDAVFSKAGESFSEALSDLKQTASEDNNSSSFDLSNIWNSIQSVFKSLDNLANNLPNIGTVYGIIQDPQKLYAYAGINGVSQEEQKRDQQKYNRETHDRDYDILKVNNSYGKETSPDLINYLNRGRALELYNASYGKIDFFDLSKNYESIAKNNGIKDDRQNMQLAEYKTMLEATSSLDSNEIDNLLEQYYRDLGLSAEDTIKTINNLTTSAKNANVPLKDYVDAVSKLSEKYRLAGINGKLAQGTIDSLVGIGLNVKDAESFGNSVATGLDKFSDNEGQVILSGLMNGKSDPFAMLWESQNTHNSDGTANENWAHSMAQGMDTMLNFNRQIFGGGALGNYRLSKMLQQDYGFTKKQAATFINAQNEGKMDSIESLLKEVQDNKTLEEINTEMLGQLQQLNSTVSEGQKADSTVQSDAFVHQEQAAQAIEQASKFLNSQLDWNNQQMQITNNLLSAYLNSSAGSFLQNNPGIAQGVQSVWGNIGNVTAIGTGIYTVGKGVTKAGSKIWGKVTGKTVEAGTEVVKKAGKVGSVAARRIGKTTSSVVDGASKFGKWGKALAFVGTTLGFTEATGATNIFGFHDNNQNDSMLNQQQILAQQQVLAQQQAMMQQQLMMQQNNINNNSNLPMDSGIPSGTISNSAYSTQNNAYANPLSLGYATGIGGNEPANVPYIPGQYTKDFSMSNKIYTGMEEGKGLIYGTGAEFGANILFNKAIEKVPVVGHVIGATSSVVAGVADYQEKKEAGYISGDLGNSVTKTGTSVAFDVGGAVAGAALGSAAAGALAGSVVPVVGNIVGAVVGGVVGLVGAFIGSKVGETLTEKDENTNNLLRDYKYIGWKQILNENYQQAGFDTDTSSLMVEALEENSEVLKDENSETRNAFAYYVAELMKNGKDTSNAWEQFNSDFKNNIDEMNKKMSESGVNPKDIGDTAEIQLQGEKIEDNKIEDMEKAFNTTDDGKSMMDLIYNEQWEKLGFDLTSYDDIEDKGIREYIKSKNFDMSSIINDAKNNDDNAKIALTAIMKLLREKNTFDVNDDIFEPRDEQEKEELERNKKYKEKFGMDVNGIMDTESMPLDIKAIIAQLEAKNNDIIDLDNLNLKKSQYTISDILSLFKENGLDFNNLQLDKDDTLKLNKNVTMYHTLEQDNVTGGGAISVSQNVYTPYANSSGITKFNDLFKDSYMMSLVLTDIVRGAEKIDEKKEKLEQQQNKKNNPKVIADYIKNSTYDDELLKKGFNDTTEVQRAIEEEMKRLNLDGTKLDNNTITRIITGIGSVFDSAMKKNNNSEGQTSLNNYISNNSGTSAEDIFSQIDRTELESYLAAGKKINGETMLEKDETGKTLKNLVSGDIVKFEVKERRQYNREFMQNKTKELIDAGKIVKPENYIDGKDYFRYNQGYGNGGLFIFYDEHGNEKKDKDNNVIYLKSVPGKHGASEYSQYANEEKGPDHNYTAQVILAMNENTGKMDYIVQKLDANNNVVGTEYQDADKFETYVKNNNPDWKNMEILQGHITDDRLKELIDKAEQIRKGNEDFHNSQQNQGNGNIAYLSMGQMMLSTSALGSSSYFNGQTKSVDNYEKEIQYLSKKSGLSWGYDQQGLSIGMSKRVNSSNYTSDIETINSFGKTKARGSNTNVSIRIDGSNAISKEIYTTVVKVFQQSGIKAVLEYVSQ